jgi:hypothetical protein
MNGYIYFNSWNISINCSRLMSRSWKNTFWMVTSYRSEISGNGLVHLKKRKHHSRRHSRQGGKIKVRCGSSILNSRKNFRTKNDNGWLRKQSSHELTAQSTGSMRHCQQPVNKTVNENGKKTWPRFLPKFRDIWKVDCPRLGVADEGRGLEGTDPAVDFMKPFRPKFTDKTGLY